MSGAEVLNLCGDYEDQEDDESLQRPVLFVPDVEENEDLSAPPMDGFQFLQRVVAERKRIDAVVVKEVEAAVKAQKNIVQQIPDFPGEKCNPEFCMDKETQLHIISEFSKLRLVYEARRAKIPQNELKKLSNTMPSKESEAEWLRILSSTPKNLSETMGRKNSSVELCLAMKPAQIKCVIEYMEDWLSEGELSIPLACQWIYTLLACVHWPLSPEMHATLRSIARVFISRRAHLDSLDSEELPHINLVICVIGRYFDQLDLADPMD